MSMKEAYTSLYSVEEQKPMQEDDSDSANKQINQIERYVLSHDPKWS